MAPHTVHFMESALLDAGSTGHGWGAGVPVGSHGGETTTQVNVVTEVSCGMTIGWV
jgi:hypothetical protein